MYLITKKQKTKKLETPITLKRKQFNTRETIQRIK